jgi:hypothetical protein
MSWFERSSREFSGVFFWVRYVEEIPDFARVRHSESLECDAIERFTGWYNPHSTQTTTSWFVANDVVEGSRNAARTGSIGCKRKAA